MSADCDACTSCVGCGLRYCRDEETSPGEAVGLCPSCWALEDPEAVAS